MKRRTFLLSLLISPVALSSHYDVDNAYRETFDEERFKKSIKHILNQYIFDSNDAATRKYISMEINQYMQNLDNIGVYAVECDDVNNDYSVIDSNRIFVDIYIKLIEYDKPVSYRFIITPDDGVLID